MPILYIALLWTNLSHALLGQAGNPAGMLPSAANPAGAARDAFNTSDRLFVYLVGNGGRADVEAAQLAGARASSSAVKQFAQLMSEDHGKANQRLQDIAEAEKVAWPKELDPDHSAMLARLKQANGSAFDNAYMQSQIVDHQKTALLLTWIISNGQNPDLRRYASETLPVVLQHLELARSVTAELSGTTTRVAATLPTKTAPASGR